MTITSTLSRVVYAGNGATTLFPFGFEIPGDSALAVVRTDADGTAATLVLGTDYSVAGAGAPGGGSVTYPLSGAPLAAGKSLTLARIVGLTQETDLTNQGAFYAEVHEDAFDKLTMIDQQQQDGLERSLRFPISDPLSLSSELPAKAARAGKIAAYGADGGPVVSAITLATVESYGTVIAGAVAAATAEAGASASAAAASANAAGASASAAAASQTSAATAAGAALASQGAAATSEANAATSAAAAAATLASALWRGMTRITAADSPYAVVAGDNGKLIVVDSSAGAVTVNLPQISGLTLPYNVGIQLDAGGNPVTVNRAGTDTIDGAASKTLTTGGAGAEFLATATPAPDEWEVIDFGFSPVTGGEGINVTGATISLNINGLTEDGAPDPAADFVASYDTSAGGHKKVKIQNIGGTAISAKSANFTAGTMPNTLYVASDSCVGTLPDASVLGVGAGFRVGLKNQTDGKDVTFSRAGTDTIDGQTTFRVPGRETVWLIKDGNGSWTVEQRPAFSVGDIKDWATNTLPEGGWAWLNAQTLSRTTYAGLFAVWGTTYGAGDGATTFGVRDDRGRVKAGKDDMGGAAAANRITAAGSGITGTTLGAAGGAETHTLTVAQMPAHTHGVPAVNNEGAGGSITTDGSGTSNPITSNSTGSTNSHNNTQPTIITNFVVKS